MTTRKTKDSSRIKVRGAAFLKAHQTGDAARFLYDAVKDTHPGAAPFAKVEEALSKLAARVAWRLIMATNHTEKTATDTKVVPLATHPDLHRIEMTELLALVFEKAPVATYDATMPGAAFWNWWDWADGRKSSCNAAVNTLTDLRREERLAAGAAAVAVLNARAAITLSC